MDVEYFQAVKDNQTLLGEDLVSSRPWVNFRPFFDRIAQCTACPFFSSMRFTG